MLIVSTTTRNCINHIGDKGYLKTTSSAQSSNRIEYKKLMFTVI